MNSSERVALARATAKKRNLCTVCVSRRPMRALTTCEICNDASRAVRDELRATAEARGVCIECLSRPVANRLVTRGPRTGYPVQRCDVCLERNAKRARKKTAGK